jgi:hypothetical protein
VARRAESSGDTASPNPDQPYQKPLLFVRTDVVGIDIGGSLAQEGLQFVLGYGNRNLALIPVAAMGSDQKVVPIVGDDVSGDGRKLDTLSVMGQFNANSATAKLNVGMDRYFATGVAARNLSTAMQVAVAAAPAGTAASAPSAGASASAPNVTAAPTDAKAATLASR